MKTLYNIYVKLTFYLHVFHMKGGIKYGNTSQC